MEQIPLNIDLSRESIAIHICDLIGKLLNKFKNKHNVYPSILFVYRSGSNEFGIDKIKEIEIPLIHKQIVFLEPEMKYIVTVVVKKVELRLIEDYGNGRYENPGQGVVIDSGLTKPDSYEFYLQPNTNSGVPTYFKVIQNYKLEKLPIEDLEEITYKLCYYYWNWNGSIKIPSCLKYAEKLLAHNTNVKCSDSDIHECLLNNPYYI